MSEYLTTGQVAKTLGLSINALQQWAKQGIVTPAFTTPGGRMRWTVEGLLAQLGGDQAAVRAPETITPPPVALAVVTAREGVLIGKRTEPPPPWSFIGGEIEDDETADVTAIRVVREDTGLQVKAGATLGQRTHPATNRLMVYVGCTPATREHGIEVGDEHHYTELRWAALSEAAEFMPDMNPRVLAHLQKVMRRR